MVGPASGHDIQPPPFASGGAAWRHRRSVTRAGKLAQRTQASPRKVESSVSLRSFRSRQEGSEFGQIATELTKGFIARQSGARGA
jgi:hypothetical protein